MNLSSSTLIALLLISACIRQQPKISDIEAEEYAVYSAVIAAHFNLSPTQGLRLQLIVIRDHTSVEPTDDLPTLLISVDQNMAVGREILNNFLARNAQSYPLDNLFNLPVDVVLISDEEMNQIFRKDTGWDDFYAQYPSSQGVMTLSRVGFNSRKDRALVYIGNQSYWLSGAGYYVLLTKKNEIWTVENEVMVWIS